MSLFKCLVNYTKYISIMEKSFAFDERFERCKLVYSN